MRCDSSHEHGCDGSVAQKFMRLDGNQVDCEVPRKVLISSYESVESELCRLVVHKSFVYECSKAYVCILYVSPCAPLLLPWLGEVEGTSLPMSQAKAFHLQSQPMCP